MGQINKRSSGGRYGHNETAVSLPLSTRLTDDRIHVKKRVVAFGNISRERATNENSIVD